MTQANNISSQPITFKSISSKPSYAPTMTLAMAQQRAQFISNIRQFFYQSTSTGSADTAIIPSRQYRHFFCSL
ncbi:translation elongation factor P [Psychrobacter sp. JCM 18900]|nr:translation elongation factor P [Psychrobacter sp. JCM 18900]